MHSDTISIIVTTYGTDTLYTQACLESIRRWKNYHHELIVVVHDESPLLRAYLDACRVDGLIDNLLYAVAAHGHTRGFNLGVEHASGDVIFNICNDILIGPSLVDDCASKLRSDRQLGIIGWHWYNEGTFWKNGQVVDYRLRDHSRPTLTDGCVRDMRGAPWYTGKFFASVGGELWLCLCNTAFFGMRTETLQRVGGGFAPYYQHYFADDLLNYAVLDQGLDVRHFDKSFRRKPYFHEFQFDNVDVSARRRHDDSLKYDGAFLDSARLLRGGLSDKELIYLHLLVRSLSDGASVTNVGVWKGASAIAMLDAMRSKRAEFHFIDGFDMPGVSQNSAQPPVSRECFLRNIRPYVGPHHNINVLEADTLDLDSFPYSDIIFVDAGHNRKCISHDVELTRNCLNEAGLAVFHDYGCVHWPDVQGVLDENFGELEVYETMAVYRRTDVSRYQYYWPSRYIPVSR